MKNKEPLCADYPEPCPEHPASLRSRRYDYEYEEDPKPMAKSDRGAAAEVERLRAALEYIRDELGVPDPGYPMPIANAANRARAALSPDAELSDYDASRVLAVEYE